MKYESSYDEDYMNDDMHPQHSLPNQYSGGSFSLQDIAFSAQQALDQNPADDDLVPVDPALQTYANDGYNDHYATLEPTNGDTVLSSVECQANDSMLMDGIELTGEPRGPNSIEPRTPGPPSLRNNKMKNKNINSNHTHQNGYSSKSHLSDHAVRHPSDHAVRHPSSPVSPRHISATSPPYPLYNNTNTIPTTPDLAPPPTTPRTTIKTTTATTTHYPPHSLRGPPNPSLSSAKKQNHTHTPSNRRASRTPKSAPGARRQGSTSTSRSSKEGIKLERGSNGATNGATLFGAVGCGASASASATAGTGTGTGAAGALLDSHLDQASRDLIKQLQQEDLGLRRRSSR